MATRMEFLLNYKTQLPHLQGRMMTTLFERWLYSKSGNKKFTRKQPSTSHEEEDDDNDSARAKMSSKQPTKKSPPMTLSMAASVEHCLSSGSRTRLAIGIAQSITA
jgi:hypothetical protein|mmetsp:Transcript_11392/g.20690  ORF Transcript_11392/g.20690 Transcript_11392/m.20690 type:complete len:106 (+) Transcript_11392:1222-1539(+)